MDENHDDALHYVNNLFKTIRVDNGVETYFFSIPQNPGNPSNYTPRQKRILTELKALQELEKLDPQPNWTSRDQFLSMFDWTDSTFDQQTKSSIEDHLVPFIDLFAKHSFDIGINTDFKVKLTPIDERAA